MDAEDLSQHLHDRLLSGDVTAPAEIAELFLPEVTAYLSRRFPNLTDPHWIDIAVTDALMNYFLRPEQFNPGKASLINYLKFASRYDLYNLLRREKSLPDSVELEAAEMEYRAGQDDDPGVEEQIIQKYSTTWAQICHLLPEPEDQEFLLMMMDGIRETAAYALLLKITDLPEDEQAKVVKRNKDRIKKMIIRHIQPDELKRP